MVLDPSNSVIKRLWCIGISLSVVFYNSQSGDMTSVTSGSFHSQNSFHRLLPMLLHFIFIFSAYERGINQTN